MGDDGEMKAEDCGRIVGKRSVWIDGMACETTRRFCDCGAVQ